MFKIEIINKSLVITSVTYSKEVLDLPASTVYFNQKELKKRSVLKLYNSYKGNSNNSVFSEFITNLVNENDEVFTSESLADFCRKNLGTREANVLDRSKHTGTQDISTINFLQQTLDIKLNYDDGESNRVLMVGDDPKIVETHPFVNKDNIVTLMSETEFNNGDITNITVNKLSSKGDNLELYNSFGRSVYMSGSGAWRPRGDDQDLGGSNTVWRTVHYDNLTNSSDERKKDFNEFPNELLEYWIKNVQFKSYKYKKNKDDKKRFGVVAQDVIKAFNECGLDWKEYNVVHEYDNGFYGVNYQEVSIIEMAANRMLINKLKEKILS